MPPWGRLLKDINRMKAPDACDIIRRKYLDQLYKYTNRGTILYAANWSQNKPITPSLLSINEEDMHGFMEAVHGVKGPDLDLIIHSPGGSAESAEALVSYLRSKFDHIRVIIPHAAMSAATMLACSADEIIGGKHSFLGPIDPQFNLNTRLGPMSIPAQAILDQFKEAKKECLEEPKNFGVWYPIIEQYGPALLTQCKNASDLAQILVGQWLEKYMFAGEDEAKKKAEHIAEILSDHSSFKSHRRHISMQEAEDMGLKITHLEDDQKLQDLVLSVYHATSITFDKKTVTKIIENHLGKAYVKIERQLVVSTPPEGIPKQPSKKQRSKKR